jgi:hypothetical protein
MSRVSTTRNNWETNNVNRGNKKVLTVGLFVAAASIALQSAAAEQDKYWDQQPYRISVSLAIDAPGDLADRLAAELPAYLERRAQASIGPLWQLSAEVSVGPLRQRALGEIESFTTKDLSKSESDVDKYILLKVRATPWGYELAGREYDRYVDRWGQTLRASTRQGDSVAEQLFALLERVVSPLAQFHLDPANDRQVILLPRGASLPRVGDFQWAAEGDIFLPIYRRTTREGELVAGGSQVVPWTFLEVTNVNAEQATGRIQSGTTRPFAIRQRGRIEQVAIALRADVGDTVVRLRSRTEKDKPLVGYQVYAQNVGEHETRLVGSSDETGQLPVGPGKTAVQLLYIKSGGELLARVPMVPGAEAAIDVPLPDDDLRLQAAARLAALREDLVDLVARRNIFIARVRQQIEDKNYQQARQLLGTLDELPTRAQFTQTLDREARLHRTKDPQVQRQIDQLFAGMQTVVGKFLDSQPIADLHEQLRQAPQKGS